MPFESLTYKERKLVEIVEEHVWDNMGDVEHVPYGYETQPNISREVRNILGRFSVEDDPTARHIRHAPDAFIVQQNPQVLYLVDYKCTTVPLRSPRLKQQISQKAGKPVEFADIGVIHTASYDNYAALQKIGVKVAILTYIAYHDRHLLCDFIETIKPLRRAPVAYTEIGSGKDVINFDASQMRTLEEFLVQTHGLPAASIAPQIQRARAKLQKNSPSSMTRGHHIILDQEDRCVSRKTKADSQVTLTATDCHRKNVRRKYACQTTQSNGSTNTPKSVIVSMNG